MARSVIQNLKAGMEDRFASDRFLVDTSLFGAGKCRRFWLSHRFNIESDLSGLRCHFGDALNQIRKAASIVTQV
jgi:hypothetical protein